MLMKNFDDINLDKICRGCLSEKGDMRSLFGSSLDNMLRSVAQVQVACGDGLPQLMCLQCVLQVSRAFRFKQQCENADTALRQYLSKKLGNNNVAKQTESSSSPTSSSSSSTSGVCVENQVHNITNAAPVAASVAAAVAENNVAQVEHKNELKAETTPSMLSSSSTPSSLQDVHPEPMSANANSMLSESCPTNLISDNSTQISTNCSSHEFPNIITNDLSTTCPGIDQSENHHHHHHHELSYDSNLNDTSFFVNPLIEESSLKSYNLPPYDDDGYQLMMSNNEPPVISTDPGEKTNNEILESELSLNVLTVRDSDFFDATLDCESKDLMNATQNLTNVNDQINQQILSPNPIFDIENDKNVNNNNNNNNDNNNVELIQCHMCSEAFVKLSAFEEHIKYHNSFNNNNANTYVEGSVINNTTTNILTNRTCGKNTFPISFMNSFYMADSFADIPNDNLSFLSKPVVSDSNNSHNKEELNLLLNNVTCNNVITDDMIVSSLNNSIENHLLPENLMAVNESKTENSSYAGSINQESPHLGSSDIDLAGDRQFRVLIGKGGILTLVDEENREFGDYLMKVGFNVDGSNSVESIPFEADDGKLTLPTTDINLNHDFLSDNTNESSNRTSEDTSSINNNSDLQNKNDISDDDDSHQSFSCKICKKSFPKLRILRRHIKIHNPVKPHVCSECGMGFTESSNLTKHKKKHTGELRNIVGKPNSCTVCGKSFKWASSLSKHMNHHTKRKILNCPYCPKYYVETRPLRIHLRTHTGERPYKCNTCEKGFTQLSNLEKHIRVHTGEKPHKCPICQKGFTQSGYVAIHMRSHTGEKPYKCKTCGKSFAGSNSLALHNRTHTGEKPYSCNICNKTFTRLETAKTHQRIHTGEKPHVCVICDKKFSSASHLSTHLKTHTGNKPYTCEICNKKLTRPCNLTLHMKIHTENSNSNTSYSCTFCKEKFKESCQLESHQLTHYLEYL